MSNRIVASGPQPVPGFVHIDQTPAGQMQMKTNLDPIIAIGVLGELITHLAGTIKKQNSMIVGQAKVESIVVNEPNPEVKN